MTTPDISRRAALRFLSILLFLLPALTFSSCESDEPDYLVGYYLTINSQVRLSLSDEDESQGTSSSPVADVLSNTVVKMREALLIAYPQNNHYGNDSGVISALDDIFMEYKSMYHSTEKNTVCVVKLYRASMDGEIVKKSRALKTYRFGARPVIVE